MNVNEQKNIFKYFFILVILQATCLISLAQKVDNHGLILRGTSYNGLVRVYDDKARFSIRVEMEFVNNGDKPVILIKPFSTYTFWTNKITFFKNTEGNREVSTFSKNVAKISKRLDMIVEGLKSEKPPENFTFTIEPGDSYQFTDSVYFKKDIKVVKKEPLKNENQELMEIEEIYENRNINGIFAKDYSSFKLEYKISLLKYQKDPDLFEKLQAKWKTFGIFPVDNSGGFTIVSELIDNSTIKLFDHRSKKNRSNKTNQKSKNSFS